MTPDERELLLTIAEQLCRPPASITAENAVSIGPLIKRIRDASEGNKHPFASGELDEPIGPLHFTCRDH